MSFHSVQDSLQGLRQQWRDPGVARAAQAAPTWTLASVPAPPGRARRLLNWNGDGPLVGWNAGGGSSAGREDGDYNRIYVGCGASEFVQASGEKRFVTIKKSLQAFIAKHPEIRGNLDLRFFGGASFSAGPPDWPEFGDATFWLPRVLYVDSPDGAQLWTVSPANEETKTLQIASEVLRLLESDSMESPPPPRALEEQSNVDRQQWDTLLGKIDHAISAGRLQKVVAARCSSLLLSAPPQIADIMARLEESAPRCARFVLRLGDRTFLGATPERLVRLDGKRVWSEALAGSIASDAPTGGARLLQSAKDLAEHQVVVEALRQALTPVCRDLDIPSHPEIRALRRILHLRTPITGTLHQAGHVLDLVERLHPTPAVGGSPKKEALEFIGEHEPDGRGWYAGPVGWMDLEGNGEFVVALRSALLHGNHAQIFAGAGIVRDSVAADEFAETELKMTSMLSALGLTGV